MTPALLHFIGRAERRALRALAPGSLCLTYDDGPGAALTRDVLALLRGRGLASFFLLARRANQHPDVVDRIAADGHELGCHTFDHLHAWKTAPWNAARDVERGYEGLARWLPPDAIFRPPYGKTNPWTAAALRRRNAPLAYWTLDAGDTHPALPDPHAVAGRARAANGAVVLLHDFDRATPDAGARARFVLEVTDLLLRDARDRGWLVRPVGEVLAGARRRVGAVG